MPLLTTRRVCEACGSDDLRTMFYPDVPLWRKECAACGSSGPFVVDDAYQEETPMLTSEEQARVAAAAEAIEAAAGMVRELLELQPGRAAYADRRTCLADIVLDLQNSRRLFLRAWSL